ncbi:hypothetical protein FHR83_005226 [Actinoplanes campanulatus]|uniref:Knr4/Smi1-like domain-containing protein n=1 Tax=Actinoplanes campanulatus TaxID=113559 RepID=A0A7W5AJP4_9ACTN|nr:SMI1/KNR4 family protein [Actinoplanes campanulatus]MBB3097548.1 hypothetical protein [Actinoplanes campanulatus]GGN27531.1 hypothetical protein GCM10010109_45180 [Actinoplanes campanulatus]GID37989.1 hypothetical protein Aca09nite_44950 [Actinoplanes campanulatus]
MTEIDWSDIRPRLAALAAHPGASEDYLGSSHGWELEPSLTAAELADLETQIGVELPADYRAFLLQAGRGGAGPACGLSPLRREDGRWTWAESPTSISTLTRAFAHIRGFIPDGHLRERPAISGVEDLWCEAPEDVPEGAAHSDGLLYLCTLGCALWVTLVVSGPSRGQIWSDFSADEEGFQPEQNPDGSRMTFTDWYRRWLTEAETSAFGR